MEVRGHPLSALLAAVVASGCAALAEPARAPSPGTGDDPGGDAAQPVDAALERLLSEPLGRHVDYWHRLEVPLPDRAHWKGTRFKRYPTRAAYQYGDTYIALAVVAYTAADGQDSPSACVKPLLKEMRAAAKAYDIEIGSMHRETRTRLGGPESVDWQREGAAERPARRVVPDVRSRPTSERQRRVRALMAGQPFSDVDAPSVFSPTEMLVVRMSGHFNTLFKRDEYVGAVVAYASWPGTCLVQGFVVRVGSDLMFARRVVTRWVEDAAPGLRWASWLREGPPTDNR